MEKQPDGDELAQSLTLIREAKAGDREALNALFQRYYPRVLQIARLRLGAGLRAKLDSQDIAQDAFARAVKGFQRFELRHEKAFIHWLGELIRNAINDQHDRFTAKKRSARQENPLEPETPGDESLARTRPGSDPTPSRVIEGHQELERLCRALDTLPAEARDVIVFRDLEQLSFAEIGELTGKSEDAARMFYSRAKAQLAGAFGAP